MSQFLVTVARTSWNSDISEHIVCGKLSETIVDADNLKEHLDSFGVPDSYKASDYMHHNGRLIRWDELDRPNIAACDAFCECHDHCAQCRVPMVKPISGRPPKYCSGACRQQAYRERQSA